MNMYVSFFEATIDAYMFIHQYNVVHGQKVLQANIAFLKLALSDQNLELIPDYEQRISVLKDLKFIDENSTIQLKGRVACEVCPSFWSTRHLVADVHLDQFCERACIDRTHIGKYPGRLRTRGSCRVTFMLCLPRKDRRGACSIAEVGTGS